MSDVKKNDKKKNKQPDAGKSAEAAQIEETPAITSDVAEEENTDAQASADVATVTADRLENDPSRRRSVAFSNIPRCGS